MPLVAIMKLKQADIIVIEVVIHHHLQHQVLQTLFLYLYLKPLQQKKSKEYLLLVKQD